MRLLRLTTNYPKYLDNFYKINSNLKVLNYVEQYDFLMKDFFGWSDVWSEALSNFDYQVWEPVANAEFQQKQWAEENSVKYNENNWLYDIAQAQIISYKPEILFVNDYYTFSYEFVKEIREKSPNIKLVIGWCGAPFSNQKVFNAYDVILTNLPSHRKLFNDLGYNVELMNHAFDRRILDKIVFKKNNDFTFLGSIASGNSFHKDRLELLSFLIKETNIKIFADLIPTSYDIYKKIKLKYYTQKLLNKLLPPKIGFINRINEVINSYLKLNLDFKSILLNSHPVELLKIAYPGLFGLNMYQELGNSLFTFNQHINISKNSSNNMRLFEATGVATCLLTEYTDDLKQLFEIDQEIVTYKNKEELLEKVRYLNENPKIAIEIGNRSQKRTLKDHTFLDRGEYLNYIIRSNLKRGKKISVVGI